MDLQKKYGAVLKKLRVAKNFSQEALALKSGIDRTYITDIENGQRNVSLNITQKLCETLDIKISDFFFQIENYE